MPDARNPAGRNDLGIYDAFADRWWGGSERWLRALGNLVPARLRFFDRVVGDWRSRRVLDLGCGGGFMAEAMARRGASVTGIDPARRAIEAARRHAAEQGLDIRYEIGSGERLPFETASFDTVVCVDVLEHVADLRRVLAEARRVSRPGGLFLFDTINRNPLASAVVVLLAERIMGLLPPGAHDPGRFIRPAEMRRALRGSGYAPGRFAGLAPCGVDRRLDPLFREVPTTAIMYIGSAVALPTGAGAALKRPGAPRSP